MAAAMAMSPKEREAPRYWRAILFGFLGIAGFFLVTEHTAHLLGALPYLLILLCPLMHLVMHRGHAAHGKRHDVGGEQ
jgi:hypothetical protein